MNKAANRPINLLALPAIQRKIVVYLSREGPADAEALAAAFGLDRDEIRITLDKMAENGTVQLSISGVADARLGRTRRRTLPARLWPALLANSRLYSTQEIATLTTAVPILQFARAKLSEFADHGPNHVLRVKSFATQLGYVVGLSRTEQHLLRAASLFHDVGNVIDRDRHHIISQETVERLTASGELPFSSREAELVGLLCRWHRKEYDPERVDQLQDEKVRTGLLASILRVADAMDIDHRRSDYGDRFSRVLEFFYPTEMPFWTSLEEISGLRIRCSPLVTLQVFALQELQENMQFNMLFDDLKGTPLPWAVEQVMVSAESTMAPLPQKETAIETNSLGRSKVLVTFPFDCHSLIMTAISRRNLRNAGYQVELLCYPDTADGPSWLWQEVLAESRAGEYDLLVAIGDRPDPAITADLVKSVSRWRSSGVSVTILNRHEVNWSRLPALLNLGVEAYLGADWAYFWGNDICASDLAWGQIASLCTRDPTQSTIGISAEQEAIVQGLLKCVYDQAGRSINDVDGWVRLSESIISRIEVDDYTYFWEQSLGFVERYVTVLKPPVVHGSVLHFDESPGDLPQAFYWSLEAAIEKIGRAPRHGVQFKTPYALATWKEGDHVELLAINHWREEAAIPIRLLYPSDLGPQPEGNESTFRVRLPKEDADGVVQALIDACNGRRL
ncbi:MAG TPA: HD domain-containing protein [Patescibacteria group bacterium]|nr:HD domain-containing protein [Patescibacteria group bacterium]